MQIISSWDNLHELTKPVLGEINPLYTEWTLPHYVLEESNFSFR